ncbi:hypothetical protein MUN78_16450 [Leucobacter allii]|uniref:Uncharacterized protein n=1 Tax=Leucobacter allii TaxID=2932247 RepID=A0ABY4FLR9_9MICO|nr:hypothetical protein [Leucobacter allii]UOQ57221.1 hypothetical protein MUN78_16450 [Leucobacter allii]
MSERSFEEIVTRRTEQATRYRREAKRWRDAALTARCGLDVKAGTYAFDRGMASIMSKALEENAAKFDEQADETMAILQRELAGEVEED